MCLHTEILLKFFEFSSSGKMNLQRLRLETGAEQGMLSNSESEVAARQLCTGLI